MRPDDVIDLRKRWARMNYARFLPESTVLALGDWLTYVQAMAMSLPGDEDLVQVLEDDVRWAWPDGVTIVFAEPVMLDHIIVSRNDWGKLVARRVTPHVEAQAVRGLAVGRSQAIRSETPAGKAIGAVVAHPLFWIAEDPADTITGQWLPGAQLHTPSSDLGISQSTRFAQAAITALGHRLTRVGPPVTAGRGERRRVQRELPSLRVLDLASGATVESGGDHHTVEWSKRWIVRGHWRLQPYGPERRLRRMRWIDPYVKGPDDKPLDTRATIWTANR